MTGATTRTLLRVLLAGRLGVFGGADRPFDPDARHRRDRRGGERVFDALSGWRGPASPPWPPTMDNEPRFYATL